MTGEKIKIYSFLVISWLLSLASWYQLSFNLEQLNYQFIILAVLLISVMTSFVIWFFVLTENSKQELALVALISLGPLWFFVFKITTLVSVLIILLAFLALRQSLHSNLKFISSFSLRRSVYPSLNIFLIILSLAISWQVYSQISANPRPVTKTIQIFFDKQVQQISNFLFDNLLNSSSIQEFSPSPEGQPSSRNLLEFFSANGGEKSSNENLNFLATPKGYENNPLTANYQGLTPAPLTLENFIDISDFTLYLPLAVATMLFLSLLSLKFFWRLIIIICVWCLFRILKLFKIIKLEKVVCEGNAWRWS